MVAFADNSPVEGMGKVLIHRRDGHQSLIIDVYVSQMKTNLLSVGQLLEKGYVMNMEHNMMKVSLSLLKKKGMVHGLPSIKPPKELCEGCLISKQTRSSFTSNILATKALLEVVYLDVCGPMESVSLGVTKEGDMMHLTLLAETEPMSFEQAIKEPEWKAALEEVKAIEKNHTWELVTLPQNKKSIGVKWVYRVKVHNNRTTSTQCQTQNHDSQQTWYKLRV
ncbi:putative mitochondrial protein, partial [Mucuna pruriens]